MSVECEVFSGMAQLLSSGNSVNVLGPVLQVLSRLRRLDLQ
jgi:hypothetical protein